MAWQVRLSWPGAAGGNACGANVQWPALEGIRVLGVAGVDPVTLTMQVLSPFSEQPQPLPLLLLHCFRLHAWPAHADTNPPFESTHYLTCC